MRKKRLFELMGYNQDASDPECTAITCALGIASERMKQHLLGLVTVFKDARAALPKWPSRSLALVSGRFRKRSGPKTCLGRGRELDLLRTNVAG